MPSPFSDVVFWASVVLCVVAQIGILRSVFAPREAPAPRPGVPTPRRVTEMLWAVVPAVGLAVLLILTWRAVHSRDGNAAAPESSASSSPLLAEATARGAGIR